MKNQEIKIKPISFSELLAGKVADGSKTMTRRIMDGFNGNNGDLVFSKMGEFKGKHCAFFHSHEWGENRCCHTSPYSVGQLLYVREPWRVDIQYDKPSGSAHIPDDSYIEYLSERLTGYTLPSNWHCFPDDVAGRYRQVRFMPARFARTFLRVTAVRCERLQELTHGDSLAEGVIGVQRSGGFGYGLKEAWDYKMPIHESSAIGAFMKLWDFINKKGPKFADNPWVWVVSFERVEMANPWNSQTVKP